MRSSLALLLFVCGCSAQITYDLSEFGTCTDSPSDAAIFTAFNSAAKNWQRANTGLVTLVVPNGATCNINGTRIADGVRQLRVSGYGATFVWRGDGFLGQQPGTYEDNLHDARTASVSAGSSSIMLLNPAQTSLFAVGVYAVMTGLDLQDNSFPVNPYYFEYVLPMSINSSTGIITLASPLRNSYLSTWPLYYSGSATYADQGGPATLYAINPSWNSTLEYDGLTIDQSMGQANMAAYSATLKDITFVGASGCVYPSQNEYFTYNNVIGTGCDIEVDKLIDNLTVVNSMLGTLLFQSADPNTFYMTGSTVTLNGTAKNSTVKNSTISQLILGTLHYGVSSSFTCDTCVVNSLTAGLSSFTDYGDQFGPAPNRRGVNNWYTMSNGVITSPNSNGPIPWAVPGAIIFWAGTRLANEGVATEVLAVTQDTKNTYIQTDLTGGFPTIPTDTTNSSYPNAIYLFPDPMPHMTCIRCSGSVTAVDLSNSPPGSPVFSYTSRTYTDANPVVDVSIWGELQSMSIDVTKPYTGLQSSLGMNLRSTLTQPDNATPFTYASMVNLKLVGKRVITPTSVTGQQLGDSALSLTGPVWFNEYFAETTKDISMESPSVWPSVTVTIQTYQGAR